MSESESKKLFELRVVDLRAELEKRGLDKNGVKKDLVERLQKALQNEGLDPETYSFDIGDKKPHKRLSTSSSHQDESFNEKSENECANKMDTSEIVSEQSNDEDKTKSALTSQAKQNEVENAENQNAEESSHQEKANQEPETINLSLEEDEEINKENVEAAEDTAEKNQKEADEKATSEDQVEKSMEATTSSSTSQEPKKNQDPDTPTANTSIATSEEPSPSKKSQSNPRILWITNVPKNTRANELKQLLSSCGKVVCAKVVVNARFPGSCCFGYVTMGSAEDATNVISKLNNTEFNGQIIKIDKFENIKADNLNPARKNKTEDNKKSQISEKKEDKCKKTSDGKSDQGTKTDDKEKAESQSSPERRKSRTSDRSSRGAGRTPSKERRSRPSRSLSGGGHRGNVLTFDKIKEERERQRMRDRERAQREDSRRRHEEAIRLREMREISRRQRNEAERLEREREKLRLERDRIEREKSELIKLERERQRIEREKLEMEKMELQRSRLRLEEDRRAVKRPLPIPYRREEPFDDRKRPNERHFEEAPRFEPPPHASKKFTTPKDFTKRLSYDNNKRETFSEKRGRDFNSERSHLPSSINRTNTTVKYDRSFDNVRGRDTREAPPRDTQSNLPLRSKDSRYTERDRSPHFRPMGENRDRHVSSQMKTDRDHHYDSNAPDRWNPVNPQNKFGSNNQKPWSAKGGTWRPEPPAVDRSVRNFPKPSMKWNPSSGSSGRSMNQPFSGNSNLTPACPPPPGINNYSDRFDYNKSGGIRKY